MKTIISRMSALIVSALVFAALCLPQMSVFAGEEPAENGKCGPDLSWCITADGTLTIEGKGAMDDYGKGEKESKAPWSYSRSEIHNITISGACTSIGNNAFKNLNNPRVSQVTISDSVERIGDHAFDNTINSLNGSLQGGGSVSLSLPSSLTSIGESAFADCEGLGGKIVIPQKTQKIEESAFEGCTGITGLVVGGAIDTIPAFAFANCTMLEEVSFGESIQRVEENAFRGCANLGEIVLPSGLLTIGKNAFYRCPHITEIFFKGNAPTIAANAFGNTDQNLVLLYRTGSTGFTTPEWNGYKTYPEHRHNSGQPQSRPASITEDGINYSTCSVCGKTMLKSYIPRIDAGSLSIEKENIYTGNEICPKPAISDINGHPLEEGTDYDVTYSNNINAGTASALLSFKGNYKGSITAEYSIGRKSIAAFNASLPATAYTFTGAAIKPEPTVSGLRKGQDYSVSYSNNLHVGTATVTIAGINNYSGQITVKFTIKQASIANWTITLSKTSYAYNGKVKKPSVKVTGIAASNYTLKYSNANSTKVGSYTVTVTGKGDYTGSRSFTYTIKPKGTKLSSVTAGSKCFTATWKKKTEQVTGYQLQYSTSATFASGNKTAKITSNKTVTKKISSLKAATKYYVRIRTYKTVDSKTYYSDWSDKMAVKTGK